MPYNTPDELPDTVRERYSARCQRVFLMAWNTVYERTGDETTAFRIAHAAAKRCQGGTMEKMTRFPGEFRFVTKALAVDEITAETMTQPLRFRTVASSTIRDTHGDEMTLAALEDMRKAFERGVVIFMNHKYDVPDNVFGQSDRAEIRETGELDANGNKIYDLYIEGFVDTSNPRALQLAKSIANGIRLGTSIGAFVKKARKNPKGRYIIEQVDLKEGSIVGIPVNQRSWVQKAVAALDDEDAEATIVDVLPEEEAEQTKGETAVMEPEATEPATEPEEVKGELSYKEREKLPDSAFACPEKRLYPIHDEAHVRNALARIANPKNDQCGRDKIIAAAKRYGIGEYAEKKSITDEELLQWAQEHLCEDCGCDRGAPSDGCTCNCHETKQSVNPPAEEPATTETDGGDVARLAGHIRILVKALMERDERIEQLETRLAALEAERDRVRAEAETVKAIITKVASMPLRPKAVGHLAEAQTRLASFAPEVAEAIIKLTED
jgi:cation transport regulator ChaB